MTGFQFKYVIRTQRGENKKLPSYLSNWEVFSWLLQLDLNQ